MPIINPAIQRHWIAPRYSRVFDGFEWCFWIFAMLYASGAIFTLAIVGKPLVAVLGERTDAQEHNSLVQIFWVGIYSIFLLFATWRLPSVYPVLKRNAGILILLPLAIMASSLAAYEVDISLRRSVGPIMLTLMGMYLAVRYRLKDILFMVAVIHAIEIWSSVFTLLFLGSEGVMSVENPGTWAGSFIHKNGLGHAAALAIFMFGYMGLRTHHLVKAFWIGSIPVCFILMIGAHSTTALLVVAGLTAILVLLRSMKRRSDDFSIIIFTVILVVAICIPLIATFYTQILEALGKDPTLTGRTTLWALGIESIVHRPFFGYGYGNFWESPVPYGGRSVRAQVGWYAPHMHNGWLEMLVDIGFVGVLIYARLFFGTLQQALAAARKTIDADYFMIILFCFYLLIASVSEAALLRNDVRHMWLTAFFVACQTQLLALRKGPEHPEMIGPARFQRVVRSGRAAR